MIITFSGIDGSGKTTYADFTMAYFKDKGIEVMYMHHIRDSFYYFLLHNFIGRFSKSTQKSLERGLRNRRSKIYFLVLALIKIILLIINMACFNIRYARYKGRGLKNNVLCDRYFYDDIVQMSYLGLANEKFLTSYKKLIIDPDIAFFIDTEPDIAYSRKSEFDKGYFIEKVRLYRQLCSSLNMVMLPNEDMEANKALIRANIDKALARKVTC